MRKVLGQNKVAMTCFFFLNSSWRPTTTHFDARSDIPGNEFVHGDHDSKLTVPFAK